MTYTDKELLELAAKAAGIDGKYFESEEGICIHTGIYRAGFDYYWNPLLSDSEALRLAVKLHIEIGMHPEHDTVTCEPKDDPASIITTEALDDYGTRRAIVRAAAEIGKRMP